MDKKVLLIDDEDSLRRTLSLGLMQKGYDTEPCENGMKALKTLETFKEKNLPLDCVVLDVKLPDIDGIKLLKVIKFNYPSLPVIMITAYGSEEVREDAKLERADAFLEKPFAIDELTHLLETLPAPEKETRPAEANQPDQAEGKARSAYMMLTFDETANLPEVYQRLYMHENVLYCDATRGDFDLVLLLQAESSGRIAEVAEKQIRSIPGLKEAHLMPVETPVLSDQISRIMGSVDQALGRAENQAMNAHDFRSSAFSYVLLEIEKEKLESVFPVLSFADQVVTCDYTSGRYNVVLLMRGPSFSQIDQSIQRTIKPLDGVLRIKKCPVIKIMEM